MGHAGRHELASFASHSHHVLCSPVLDSEEIENIRIFESFLVEMLTSLLKCSASAFSVKLRREEWEQI